jgi:hypothetical protein
MTIGGVTAEVTFAGLAPGNAGLYQINARIPEGAPTGLDVPIVLTIGGIASNTTTIIRSGASRSFTFPPTPNPAIPLDRGAHAT